MSEQPTDKPILEQLLATMSGLALCWLGNVSWLIRGEGLLIAFDLDLADSDNRLRKSPVSAEELAPSVDVVFYTHAHGDHFNEPTASVLAEKSGCLFVVPSNCVRKAESLGIPEERIVVACPGERFELLGLPVRPTRAFHGHRGQIVYNGANLDDCGYLLTIAGRTLFQPGDSVLTQEHLDLQNVDILFVSPTSHNMAVDPASVLIRTLRPGWIFPQHFDTYKITPENDFWTVGQPDELGASIEADLQQNYHKLSQGDVFAIE